jgi:hypothetical protein
MGAPDLRQGASDSPAQRMPAAGGGGSFLGTAAAAAAGVIGGALLLNGIRSMFGESGSAHAAFDPGLTGTDRANPWSGSESGDLGRQAGIDSVGRPPADPVAASASADTAAEDDSDVDDDEFDDDDLDDDEFDDDDDDDAGFDDDDD